MCGIDMDKKLNEMFESYWKQKQLDDENPEIGFPKMWERANNLIEQLQTELTNNSKKQSAELFTVIEEQKKKWRDYKNVAASASRIGGVYAEKAAIRQYSKARGWIEALFWITTGKKMTLELWEALQK